jgi:flagellar biosynthetic protein FliP
VGIVLFMGFLTLLPTLLLLMTSFTRILVVLHLLKQALGTQTAPPGHLVAAMALLLTGFVMAPTLSEANRVGFDPWVRGEIDEVAMLQEASVPFRGFMLSTMRQQDLEAFMEMGRVGPVETVDDVPLVVVMTAFVTSELRAAFQMGFALFLPFVVIDLVVASVLMSMGMFMLPPIMVSLPFKLLLFVMVDGWTLVMEGIVRSFPY